MRAHVVPQPFRFDRDFGAPPVGLVMADAPPAEPAAGPSEADVAAAHAEGYAAGREAALADAAAAEAAQAAQAAQALDRIAASLVRLEAERVGEDDRILCQAAAIGAALCRKLLPAAYRRTAEAAVAELVAGILPRVSREPRLRVHLAPALVAGIGAPLADIKDRAAFAGAIEVVAAPDLAPGDCRIGWSQGGVERDATALWRDVEALLTDVAGLIPPDPSDCAPVPGVPGQPPAVTGPAEAPTETIEQRGTGDA
jgi:flagellar assembly protein FliH